MKHYFLTTLFSTIITFFNCYSQNLQHSWSYIAGSTDADKLQGIELDQSQNIVEVGSFRGTIDIDPGPGTLNFTSQGFSDTYIRKLDPNGNLIWAKTFGGNRDDHVRAMHIDENDNIFLTGDFSGTCDFDPGAGTVSHTSFGTPPRVDMFVLKLDPNGNYVWSYRVGGLEDDRGLAINSDPDGFIYVGGVYEDSIDFNPAAPVNDFLADSLEDAYLLKLTSNGDYVWSKTYNGMNDVSLGKIRVNSEGDLVICGSFKGTVDFDPTAGVFNITADSLTDGFVGKIDSAGTTLWINRYGGMGEDHCFNINLDNQDDIFLVGTFQDTVDLDPTGNTDQHISNGSRDVYVQRMNTVGIPNWTRSFGGDSLDFGRYIMVDSFEHIFISGDITNTVDFDPGTGTDIKSSLGGSDTYIARYDYAGNYEWAEVFGGSDNQVGLKMQVSSNSEIYFAGNIYGQADFDPSTGVSMLASAGNDDNFIAKYNYCAAGIGVTEVDSVTLMANQNGATYQWIECTTGPILGATNQSYTITENGDYGVIVSISGCTDTSECFSSTLGISSLKLSNTFSVYPNPSAGIYNIELGDQLTGILTISDVSGRIIKTYPIDNSNYLLINLEGDSGLYYFTIETEKESATKTVLLE